MDLTTWPESNPCNPGVLGIQSKTARKQISLNPASLKVWVTARAPISQSPIHSSKSNLIKATHIHIVDSVTALMWNRFSGIL